MKKHTARILALALALLVALAPTALAAGGTVTQASATQLLDAMLNGIPYEGAEVILGEASQMALFSAPAEMGLPFSSGIMLSTGACSNAFAAEYNNDLDGLDKSNTKYYDGFIDANGNPITDNDINNKLHDTVVLKFTVTPTQASLQFRYFFASAEYKWGGDYNDAFALWISGEDGEKHNIALTAEGKQVNIMNTIGGENKTTIVNDNSYDLNGYPFNFDGYTDALIADATSLFADGTLEVGKPVDVYFAIADHKDAILHSAVFLQAGSFTFDPDAYNQGPPPAPYVPVLPSVPSGGTGVTTPEGGTSATTPDGGTADGGEKTITVTDVAVSTFEGIEEHIQAEANMESAFADSVEVRLQDDDGVRQSFLAFVGEDAQIYPFDISLYSKATGAKVQPEEGYGVQLTLPLPEELWDVRDEIQVAYIDGDVMNALPSELVFEDGIWKIVFETNHFSPYALIVGAALPSVTSQAPDAQEESPDEGGDALAQLPKTGTRNAAVELLCRLLPALVVAILSAYELNRRIRALRSQG